MTPRDRLVAAAIVVASSKPSPCPWCHCAYAEPHSVSCAFGMLQDASQAMIDEAKQRPIPERLAA